MRGVNVAMLTLGIFVQSLVYSAPIKGGNISLFIFDRFRPNPKNIYTDNIFRAELVFRKPVSKRISVPLTLRTFYLHSKFKDPNLSRYVYSNLNVEITTGIEINKQLCDKLSACIAAEAGVIIYKDRKFDPGWLTSQYVDTSALIFSLKPTIKYSLCQHWGLSYSLLIRMPFLNTYYFELGNTEIRYFYSLNTFGILYNW